MKIKGTIVRFSMFVVSMLIVLSGLVIVFGQFRFDSTVEYSARFADISGLKTGNFVRIAGVEVGSVKSIALSDDNTLDVDFDVRKGVGITEATHAIVRYENLIGDRYLELAEGPGDAGTLPAHSQIPLDKTAPALDLDALLGGFRPLFKALDPDQVNKISSELIAVFQGKGGTIANVLSQTATLTSALADRDELIGAVITNLNGVLGTVAKNDAQFKKGIDSLQQLVSGLSRHADPLSLAVSNINSASNTVASLLEATRPDIQEDINQIHRVSTVINNDSTYVDNLLGELPQTYRTLSRLGLYGDFFSFYLCDITLKVNGPHGDPAYIQIAGQRAGRCTVQ